VSRPSPRGDRSTLVGWVALAALGVVYLPRGFWTDDLIQAFHISRSIAPLRWDWIRLGQLAVHGAGLLLTVGGAGHLAMRWMGRRGDPGMAGAGPWLTGWGCAMLGLTVLGCGLTGLLLRPCMVGIYGLLGGAGCWFLIRWLRERQNGRTRRPGEAASSGASPERWLFVVCAAWCGLLLAGDLLAPESSWDAIVYHLGVPRRFLEAHKIILVLPFFSNLPCLISMDYVLALSLVDEGLARVLNLILGGCFVLTVWNLARRIAGPAHAWMTAALVMTTPLIGMLMIHAGADMGAAFFSLLAVSALVAGVPRWPRGRFRSRELVEAGIMAGFAGGAKMTALATGVACCALVAPYGPAAVLLVASPLAFVDLPWILRSWLMTGNPAYPFFSGTFPGPAWPAFTGESYTREMMAVRSQLSFGDYAGWLGRPALAARFKLGSQGTLPMLVLLGALQAVMRGTTRGARAVLLLIGGVLAACWAHASPVLRFFTAGVGVLAVLQPVESLRRGLRRAVAVAAVGVNLVWFPLVIQQIDDPWPVVRGDIAPAEYYATMYANLPMDAFHMLDAHLPRRPGGKVLAVGEARNFLTPPDTITPSYFDPVPLLVWARESSTGRRVWIRCRQRNIQYVMVNVPEMLRLMQWEGQSWAGPIPQHALAPFFKAHCKLLYARGAAWIYRVGAAETGAVLPECFQEAAPGSRAIGLSCISLSSSALAAGDARHALTFGWAAVASAPHSGLAWATLGDGLYVAQKYDQAIGAYAQAEADGWRTSAVFRNQALALAELKKFGLANQALQYAIQVDPDEAQIREDLYQVNHLWVAPGPGGRKNKL